ncbi:MAG: hypothetical protein HRU19_04815 [Pseudobacteriovorax sp.]|nr:hypothetical protein [Pseudobacteriovorax sp.]
MKVSIITGLLFGGLAFTAYGQADALKVARAKVSTVYKRLASVPPPAADLENWAAAYVAATDDAGKNAALLTVAQAATANDFFYSRTVRNFADPETNEGEELIEQNLSDYTATIVGFIRDGLDYRTILYDDVVYIPNAGLNLPYSPENNDSYAALEELVRTGQQPLAGSLTQSTQTAVTQYPVQAGIYTLRGYGSVFYNDGTNRSPLRYTFINYLCKDMEELSDVTRPDIYVRRDVDRTPGGDGEKFRTECVGCHAGMDPQTSAFAFVDFDPEAGRITYSQTPVPKVNRNNDTFPNGAAVTGDAWLNIWYEGTNANLGWSKEIKSGNGPKSWGQAMADTEMFPQCMAKRVYEVVCLQDGTTNLAKANISAMATQFVAEGHNMKKLFENTAALCGEQLSFDAPAAEPAALRK